HGGYETMTFEEFQKYIKNENPPKNCPVSRALELLSGKWTSRVIYELEKSEQLRFGQIKKRLEGITNTMLSATLKVLEEQGIVERKQYNEVPLRVEYSLTEAGKAMIRIFYEMAKWGSTYLFDDYK
ncbi:MAG: winged helix-turn-helix transcriptional regulator, partial [Oscillospiraceae bacterium]